MAIIRNEQADWSQFSPEKYNEQYDQIIWEDTCISRMVIGALDAYQVTEGVQLRSLKSGLVACSGSVLREPGLMAPYIADDGFIDCVDFSEPQIEDAKNTLQAGRAGYLGRWTLHQEDMGRFQAPWSDAIARACSLGKAVRGSIYELPEAAYQIGATFCGPESITADRTEWQRGVESIVSAVEPGGPVIIVSVYGSNGYNSAGVELPATTIYEPDVLDVVGPHLRKIQTFSILASHEMRPADDPHTYVALGGVLGLHR